MNTIGALLAADVPVLLWGSPGIGKTASIVATATEAGAHLEVLACGSLDSPDVVGYLVPHDGKLSQVPPPWAARLRAALDAGTPAWVFFDEASCARPSVQAALLRVIQEREVAGLSLRGCRVIAAANPAESAADGGWLAPAIAGRFAHVDVPAPPVQEWCNGLLRQWGLGWSRGGATGAASIAGWVQRQPKALMAPAERQDGRAWPSPRSWHAAARGLGSLADKGFPCRGAAAEAVVAACVGAPAASEWHAWMMACDLPDPEAMLAGTATWPERGDQRLATATALVAAALVGDDDDVVTARVKAAWGRLAELRPEQALGAAQALADGHWSMPAESDGLLKALAATKQRLGK